MKSANFSYFKKIGEDIWYISRSGGGLFKRNLEAGEETCVYMPLWNGNVIDVHGIATYNYLLVDGDEIWMIPIFARNIAVWNMKLSEGILIPFPEAARVDGEYFLYAVQTDEKIIVFPKSYQGIFLIDKKTKEIEIDDKFYKEYIRFCRFFGTPESFYVFQSNIILMGETLYVPFQNINKLLKYNYVTMAYSLLDTVRVGNFMEYCTDNGLEFYIINRISIMSVDNIDSVCQDIIGTKIMDNLTKVFRYHSKIYFFTKKTIYVYDMKRGDFIEEKWINEISKTYGKRSYHDCDNKDDIVDVLYVFIEEDSLNITYEYDDKQVVVIIKDDDAKIYEYERYIMSWEENLVEILSQKENSRDCACNGIRNVGMEIYKRTINDAE